MTTFTFEGHIHFQNNLIMEDGVDYSNGVIEFRTMDSHAQNKFIVNATDSILSGQNITWETPNITFGAGGGYFTFSNNNIDLSNATTTTITASGDNSAITVGGNLSNLGNLTFQGTSWTYTGGNIELNNASTYDFGNTPIYLKSATSASNNTWSNTGTATMANLSNQNTITVSNLRVSNAFSVDTLLQPTLPVPDDSTLTTIDLNGTYKDISHVRLAEQGVTPATTFSNELQDVLLKNTADTLWTVDVAYPSHMVDNFDTHPLMIANRHSSTLGIKLGAGGTVYNIPSSNSRLIYSIKNTANELRVAPSAPYHFTDSTISNLQTTGTVSYTTSMTTDSLTTDSFSVTDASLGATTTNTLTASNIITSSITDNSIFNIDYLRTPIKKTKVFSTTEEVVKLDSASETLTVAHVSTKNRYLVNEFNGATSWSMPASSGITSTYTNITWEFYIHNKTTSSGNITLTNLGTYTFDATNLITAIKPGDTVTYQITKKGSSIRLSCPNFLF